jgi:signal transduction histidine kinase
VRSLGSRTLRDSLTVIEEESDRLNELINNLLDASRLERRPATNGRRRARPLAASTVDKFAPRPSATP